MPAILGLKPASVAKGVPPESVSNQRMTSSAPKLVSLILRVGIASSEQIVTVAPLILGGAAISGQLQSGAEMVRISEQPARLVTVTISASPAGIPRTVKKPPPPVTVPAEGVKMLSASVLIRIS